MYMSISKNKVKLTWEMIIF